MASVERVNVACKLPNGLKCYIYKEVELPEQQDGRVVMAKRYVRDLDHEPILLKGVAMPMEGERPPHLIIAGAAITTGVPKDKFEEWLRQNSKHPAVVNRMVFAMDKQDSIIAKAKGLKTERSGQQPLSPTNDPRTPKGRYAVKPAKTGDADMGDDE